MFWTICMKDVVSLKLQDVVWSPAVLVMVPVCYLLGGDDKCVAVPVHVLPGPGLLPLGRWGVCRWSWTDDLHAEQGRRPSRDANIDLKRRKDDEARWNDSPRRGGCCSHPPEEQTMKGSRRFVSFSSLHRLPYTDMHGPTFNENMRRRWRRRSAAWAKVEWRCCGKSSVAAATVFVSEQDECESKDEFKSYFLLSVVTGRWYLHPFTSYTVHLSSTARSVFLKMGLQKTCDECSWKITDFSIWCDSLDEWHVFKSWMERYTQTCKSS